MTKRTGRKRELGPRHREPVRLATRGTSPVLQLRESTSRENFSTELTAQAFPTRALAPKVARVRFLQRRAQPPAYFHYRGLGRVHKRRHYAHMMTQLHW